MIKKSFKTFLYLIATFLILCQVAYALNVVKLSPEYFPNTSRGRALSSADIYVGTPDLDPEIIANQKTLSVQQEDGTIVAVTQPISTGAGGVPLYLGSPVTLLVSGDYSLKVLDSHGVQIYYVPSVLYYTPLTTPYAQYYPDYTEVDQGAAGGGNSVYDIQAEVGTVTNATMYFAHNSGAATTTYTFTTNEAITDNFKINIENGVIFDGVGTLTFDIPSQIIAQPNQQIFGASITLAFTNPGTVYPEWWGAVGDGVADDSVPIQATIDALEVAKGGIVQFLSKTYECNITLKGYVGLEGASTLYRPDVHNKTVLLANATGVIVDTPVAAAKDMSIRNITFQGLGSGVALVGLRLRAVNKGTFENLAFNNIADQAILLNVSTSNKFDRIFAHNCLLDTSQAAKVGVLQLNTGSTDNFVLNSEFNSSIAALSDVNAYICAVMVSGAHNFFTNVIAELSDIGFHVEADSNHFSNCRADLNWTHGWDFAATAGGNVLVGCEAYKNSKETNNTYNGFNLAGDNNSFSGCYVYNAVADTEKHKYGFYDPANSSANRNVYTGCYSVGHGTAWFFDNDAFTGTGAAISQKGPVPFTADDATPSVDNFQFFLCGNYTAPTNITDFDDGYAGQIIHLLDTSATGRFTIVNGTNIYTNTGVNVTLTQNYVYSFIKYNNKWHALGS